MIGNGADLCVGRNGLIGSILDAGSTGNVVAFLL